MKTHTNIQKICVHQRGVHAFFLVTKTHDDIGGYYQLQMIAYSKAGMLGNIWWGGWIFHPEYLERNGQPYRKKLLACWAIFLLLGAILKTASV
ncbi:MAG: hypothetical protein WCA63_02420 [Gallionella sp.]